jgi:hypothetical protein
MFNSLAWANLIEVKTVGRVFVAAAIVLGICLSSICFGQERSWEEVDRAKDLAFKCVDAQSPRENQIGKSTAQPISLDVIRSILSQGEVDIVVLGVEVPRYVRRTGERISEALLKNAAIAKDADTIYQIFLEAGITDEELARMEEFKKNITLTPIDVGRVRFSALPDDRMEIRDIRNASLLDRLRIDLKSDTATHRSYTLASDRAILASADQVAFGPYEARSWTKPSQPLVSDGSDTVQDGSNLVQTKLFIGRLTKTDENMICISTEFVAGEIPLGSENLVVRFKRRSAN